MTKILISIVWLLVFTKLLVFWVWLWQLKNYHWKRLKAHFETQRIRKMIFSLHGIRSPKLTQKVIVVLVFGILVQLLFLFFIFNFTDYLFYTVLLISVILAPIIISLLILLFQIPVNILIKRTLKKAEEKRKDFKNLTVIGITGSYGNKSSTNSPTAGVWPASDLPGRNGSACRPLRSLPARIPRLSYCRAKPAP